MNDKLKFAPLLVWIAILLIELGGYLWPGMKPMYFRAWEFALNEGKDSYYVPFKPLIRYDGIMQGDLLTYANFIPKKGDTRHQLFITDEYGFRNKPYLLKKPIKAVIIGSSFVGGAQTDQSMLISSLLTEKYNLPTYNYSTPPLQHFWEDERFIKTPPETVIIVGNESEFLQNSWIEVVKNTSISHKVPSWSNYESWKEIQDPIQWKYEYISKNAKRFSMTRYLTKQLSLQVSNKIFSRAQIANELIQKEQYDAGRDMLFFDVLGYSPLLSDKSQIDIDKTVSTLLETKEVLKTRNINLIVAIVPSKASLYAKRFRNIDASKKTLPALEQKLLSKNINIVPTSEYLYQKANETKVYYKDDSHWGNDINVYLSEKIADKLRQNR